MPDVILDKLSEAFRSNQWTAVANVLAPWLNIDKLRADVAQEKQRVLTPFNYASPPKVIETNAEHTDATFDEVASDTPFPDQVSAENFKSWSYLQFIHEPDADDLEAAIDIWLALANTNDGVKVGYYEFGDGG